MCFDEEEEAEEAHERKVSEIVENRITSLKLFFFLFASHILRSSSIRMRRKLAVFIKLDVHHLMIFFGSMTHKYKSKLEKTFCCMNMY